MKCKECNCCHEEALTRWSSVDRNYVTKYVHKCYGVKEPFIIENINVECTEYPEYRNKVVEDVSIEKAIEHFKYGISHDIFSEPVTSYAKMAVEALEKQIENEEEGYWFLLDECANEGIYCFKCYKKVYKKDYANQKLKSKFCPNCGKRMSGDFKVL